jgi:hypothetical protein
MLVTAVQAAPSTTVKVTADQRLVIPAATVKKLGLKQKRGQLICIQFPKASLPPGHRLDDGHGHAAPADVRPPKVYLGLRNDGALVVPRMRALTSTGFIPGKPGTVYRGVVQKGVLVLTRVK